MHADISGEVQIVRADDGSVDPGLNLFVGTIFGGASIELSEALAEQARSWRLKRSIKILEKARQRLDAAGLPPRAVETRVLVPLLEAASLDDDGEMVERWASLLANAAARTANVAASFPTILRETEPIQAKILDSIYALVMSFAPELRTNQGATRESIGAALQLADDEVRFHLDNLMRLRLVVGKMSTTADDTRTVTLTEFGRAFVRACLPPGFADPEVVFHENLRESATVILRHEGGWRVGLRRSDDEADV